MGELYLRKVKLTISGATGGSTTIEDLRVRFRFEKTNEGQPNIGELDIYNLSDATRSTLEAKGATVSVEIGYEGLQGEGNIENIFTGDVTKVFHKRETADVITDVTLGDGDNKYRNKRHDKGYPKNAKAKQIFDDVINSFGWKRGNRTGIPNFT